MSNWQPMLPMNPRAVYGYRLSEAARREIRAQHPSLQEEEIHGMLWEDIAPKAEKETGK